MWNLTIQVLSALSSVLIQVWLSIACTWVKTFPSSTCIRYSMQHQTSPKWVLSPNGPETRLESLPRSWPGSTTRKPSSHTSHSAGTREITSEWEIEIYWIQLNTFDLFSLYVSFSTCFKFQPFLFKLLRQATWRGYDLALLGKPVRTEHVVVVPC